jgi:tetratricopeptide (TPR) repeat protein
MNPTEIEQAARRAGDERNWDQAYKHWEELSAVVELSPDQRLVLARTAAYSGRLDEAEDALRVLEGSPVSEFNLATLRADISELRKDYSTSLHWRRAAAKIQPESYWTLFGIARARNGLQHPVEEVVAEFRPALKLPEAEQSGRMFAARLLARTGDIAGALELAEQVATDKEELELWALKILPGMTSEKERLTARELVRNLERDGQIVDLGCWLGSLSAALASGLKMSPRPGKPERIIAYDKFEWVSSYMEHVWRGSQYGLKDGDDFLPWFREITARWEDYIDVRKTDLETMNWTDGPIALLIVDAMKTPAVARHIIATFFGQLVPGAYVFHQDFCHYHTWWIHLYHYRMRDKFRLVDTVEGSGTVVFQVETPFRGGEIDALLATDLTDAALSRDAFEYSLSLADPTDHREILRAYANCERLNGRPDRASQIEARISGS